MGHGDRTGGMEGDDEEEATIATIMDWPLATGWACEALFISLSRRRRISKRAYIYSSMQLGAIEGVVLHASAERVVVKGAERVVVKGGRLRAEWSKHN